MNDADLIRAVQAGDRDSLTTFYQRYLGVVWRHVYAHLSRDPAAAEDLVSETFLAAIRSIQDYEPAKGAVYGWLLGIARNHLRVHRRRAARENDYAGTDAVATAYVDIGKPEDGLIRTETRDAVVRALGDLADEERLVLEWKYLESLSVREMAERLGRTEKAVEAILYRARKSFRVAYVRQQTPTT
jgi:RNA polymerase sigma-70 factor (ECF subfamily)